MCAFTVAAFLVETNTTVRQSPFGRNVETEVIELPETARRVRYSDGIVVEYVEHRAAYPISGRLELDWLTVE